MWKSTLPNVKFQRSERLEGMTDLRTRRKFRYFKHFGKTNNNTPRNRETYL